MKASDAIARSMPIMLNPARAILFATFFGFFVWYIVDTACTQRMTPPDTPDCQPESLNPTVLFQSFQSICRASGVKTTPVAHPRAEDQTVGAHGQSENVGKRGHDA